jgi:hydroxyacylglutathione hydrolase
MGRMTLSVFSVPMLSDNYAWILRDDSTGSVAFVDPADGDAAIRAIEEMGGRLDLILLTHHHDDHIAGVGALRARFDCPVIGGAADAHRLPPLDRQVAEGDEVTLGTARGRVIDTRGHTSGHISYFFPDGPVLFCGDTLFSLGCGRMAESTPEQFFTSLRKIAALPPDTLICAGHEYTQANARFALHVDPDNALLRETAAAVDRKRAAHEQTLPVRLRDELPVNPFLLARDAASFGRLRAAKDVFKG